MNKNFSTGTKYIFQPASECADCQRQRNGALSLATDRRGRAPSPPPLPWPYGVFHLAHGALTMHFDSLSERGVREKNRPRWDPDFPPPGFRPTAINKLLVNALDLTAPASDALLKNRKNAWIQLAGHPGSFAPAGPHTIWKKRMTKADNETLAYQALMNDSVRDIVPKFYREVEYNGDIFIEIEDLLQHFTDPSILDIKMGMRTFLESEVKNPVLRKDLYEKMIKLNPQEPTPEEHEQKAITKLRYMQFREKGSSTSSLGFRIEAIRMSGDTSNCDLKKVHTKEEVSRIIAKFIRHNKEVQQRLLRRFQEMRQKFAASKFFKTHEIVGGSILVLYDLHHHGNAWMIDFAKTLPIPTEARALTHRTPWEIGNHEDGYLTGLDNLLEIVSDLDLHASGKEAASLSVTKDDSGACIELPETRTETGKT